MSFSDDEKEVLRTLVSRHISEIQDLERMTDLPAFTRGADFNYEQFLKELLEKLG